MKESFDCYIDKKDKIIEIDVATMMKGSLKCFLENKYFIKKETHVKIIQNLIFTQLKTTYLTLCP